MRISTRSGRTVAALAGLALAGATVLGGCETPPTKEQTGAVVGGVVGGVLGSHVGKGKGRTAAIIAGTLVGAMIGGSIGRYMDAQDRMRTARALEYNRTGQPSRWRNPDTGATYEVTPTRTYETAEGPCREFTMRAEIGGRPETVYGTACRQPDGSWRMVGG